MTTRNSQWRLNADYDFHVFAKYFTEYITLAMAYDFIRNSDFDQNFYGQDAFYVL